MRLKQYKLLGCLAALSLVLGCSFYWGKLRGSGIAKTESREVTQFSSISTNSVGKIIIKQTGKESLTITADDNILPLLESRVADNILYLTIKNDTSFNPTQPIEFMVEVKRLESLKINGVGSVEVQDIQSKNLSISFDGVGGMTIAGNVDVLDLSLDGVGSFNGENLKTKQATIRSKGVGSVVVNVSEQLDASVLGLGSIEYIGSPQVKEFVKGLGSVKKR